MVVIVLELVTKASNKRYKKEKIDRELCEIFIKFLIHINNEINLLTRFLLSVILMSRFISFFKSNVTNKIQLC